MVREAAAAFFLLLCLCSNAHGKSRRFGAISKTIHVPRLRLSEQWAEKFVVIQADSDLHNTDDVHVEELLKRFRRDAAAADRVKSTVAPLNDSHTMLIVHWAGENSNVIIALAKSSSTVRASTSSVFVSRDYGASFRAITSLFTGATSIDKYFNSDLLNSHYVFTDVIRGCVFTTRDYAATIFSNCGIHFKPTVVSLSPTNANHILAFDSSSFSSDLYLSEDFGQSWRAIRSNVKAFFWGIDPYDPPNSNTLYVEEKRGFGGNIVLRSTTYFSDGHGDVVIQGVEDFEMQEEYMFATKKVRLLGSRQGSTYQFWVSYKRGDFVNAQFPRGADNHTDYFVADASEDQVMVCVTHGNLNTSLYISDVQGSRFSLSLENIVYFSPTGANSDTWLSFYASESFVDIHKVAGLRGIYIASQLVESNRLSVESQRSLITFDKGGQWELLNPPTDIGHQLQNCSKAAGCSLHVSQEFQHLYPGSLAQPLLSRDSAPGILIASGTIGDSLRSELDIFVSADAGFSWHKVLEGSYLYAMADHGGILVAVQQFQPTDTIYYSINEGQTWRAHKFVNQTIRVYGLLTEPGERTTIFSLFGSYLTSHSWILVQINMSAVLGSPCREVDYKDWSVLENNPDAGCLLGRKVVYQRRNTHAVCYNGEDFVRSRELQNCSCTRNDFECDFGWMLDQNLDTCVSDGQAGLVDNVPYPCPPGTYYQHSQGYRRVSGDTCVGGSEHSYAPVLYSCPAQERSEFLLVAQRQQILALDLDSFSVTTIFTLPAGQTGYLNAVAFDYQNNTVYWGIYEPAKIESLNLNASSKREVATVAEGRMLQISSLALDWTAGHLYWTDQEKRTIEVVSTNGLFRRHLISNNSQVVKPAHLVIDPAHGQMYWLELSVGRQSLMRAWMDGTHIEAFGPRPLLNMPQGLTLDLSSERLYWTQGVDNHVRSITVNGTDLLDLSVPTLTSHSPGPVSVYKNSIYWVNNIDSSLVIAEKHSGVAWIQMTFNYTVVDMETVSHTSQQAQSACSPGHPRCSQLCLPKPHATDLTKVNRTCLCGDGFQVISQGNSNDERCVCGTNERMTPQGRCELTSNTSRCRSDQFKCLNQRCIPLHWKCDREDDCGDTSDEIDCPFYECPSGTFKCKNGRCIPQRWVCDFDNDCRDEAEGTSSDEANCVRPNCAMGQFRCDNQRCIPAAWRCDFDNDCHDNSDELNCGNKTCQAWEHTCNNSQCIPSSSICNGMNDCRDGSDERNCHVNCSSMQFKCANSSRCLHYSWRCDGDRDCIDGSDEANCTATTTPITMSTATAGNHSCSSSRFQCDIGFCIDFSLICNGVDDCGDGSDERFCGFLSTTTTRPCGWAQFRCNSGQCVSQSQRCDGQRQCSDGSDENLCDVNTCAADQFVCNTTTGAQRHCIWNSWVCDGEPDCPLGEDEEYCQDIATCGDDHFQCMESGECIPVNQRCNHINECDDKSDERDCAYNMCEVYTGSQEACCTAGCAYLACREDDVYGCFNKSRTFGNSCSAQKSLCSTEVPSGGNVRYFYTCPGSGQPVHMMLVCDAQRGCLPCPGATSYMSLSIGNKSSTSAYVKWEGGQHDDSFIVSYFDSSAQTDWNNITVKDKLSYNISNLKPFTSYTFTVYVLRESKWLYPSNSLEFRTDPGKPSKPRHVEAFPTGRSSILLKWQPPIQPNGKDIEYLITIEDRNTETYYIFKKEMDQTDLTTEVIPGHTYSIIVKAKNTLLESDEVQLNLTYNLDMWPNLKASEIKNTSVKLTWDSVNNAHRYIVTANLEYQYRQIQKTTDVTSLTFDGLCPGTSVNFWVKAEVQDGLTLSSNIVSLNTTGSAVPVVEKLSVQLADHNVQLTLTRPKNAIEVQYVLYYDTSSDPDMRDFISQARTMPVEKGASSVNLSLVACTRYFFRVGVEPDTCPMSPEVVIRTKEDNKASPRRFQAEIMEHSYLRTVYLTWDASCDSISTSLGYNLTVTCASCKNKSLNIQQLSYEHKSVTRGENYTFILQTALPGSQSVQQTVLIPPYPAPKNVEVEEMENSKVRITWELPKDRPPAEDFKGFNLTIQHDDDIIVSKVTQDSSYLFEGAPGHLYSLTVQVLVRAAPPGAPFRRLFSSYEASASRQDGAITLSKTNLVAILVPVAVVVVGLVVVMMVFVVRHRRLQRSFLAFANSHYNTRSGTTTFGTELDDGDEPLIQGFSDDEPLVLA